MPAGSRKRLTAGESDPEFLILSDNANFAHHNLTTKMDKIKFGTDGWRAIIAKDFTVENVARVSEATANWLLKQKGNPSVIVGYDCRFGGELFSETVAIVLASKGIKVF